MQALSLEMIEVFKNIEIFYINFNDIKNYGLGAKLCHCSLSYDFIAVSPSPGLSEQCSGVSIQLTDPENNGFHKTFQHASPSRDFTHIYHTLGC